MVDSWKILFHKETVKDFNEIGVNGTIEIMKMIESIKEAPGESEIFKRLPECFFLNSNKYQVLYQLNFNKLEILILVVRKKLGLLNKKSHSEVG